MQQKGKRYELKEEIFNCIGFNIETDWLAKTIAWKFVTWWQLEQGKLIEMKVFFFIHVVWAADVLCIINNACGICATAVKL